MLDVRTPAEFETAHIAGGWIVPLDLLCEHRDEIVGTSKYVVSVCRSGQRAPSVVGAIGVALAAILRLRLQGRIEGVERRCVALGLSLKLVATRRSLICSDRGHHTI